MSKSLRSMTKEGRAKAIERRLKSQTKGNGYWAAVDAKKKIEMLHFILAKIKSQY